MTARKIRILFVSTWESQNALSRSTVHPHLVQLTTYDCVERIFYISLEPVPCSLYEENSGKVEHIPIVRSNRPHGLVTRAINEIKSKSAALEIVHRSKPDLVICRGAPAGAFGYKIWRKFRIPYCVESFEPHADYMLESGVWARHGIKYLIQRLWEQRVKETAALLITVSERYAQLLIAREGVARSRVKTVPCWVDTNRFRYNEASRNKLRAQLGIKDSLVGIYLGKFGGLYYEPDVLRTLGVIRDSTHRHLFLFILTPSSRNAIAHTLNEQGFGDSDYYISNVDYEDIPAYLSASDFALSFVKSTPVAAYCSPIKHGEYWASGLPLITSENVGDESTFIDIEGLGHTADFRDDESVRQATLGILDILEDSDHRKLIQFKGTRRRSKESLIAVYDEIIREYSGFEDSR